MTTEPTHGHLRVSKFASCLGDCLFVILTLKTLCLPWQKRVYLPAISVDCQTDHLLKALFSWKVPHNQDSGWPLSPVTGRQRPDLWNVPDECLCHPWRAPSSLSWKVNGWGGWCQKSRSCIRGLGLWATWYQPLAGGSGAGFGLT